VAWRLDRGGASREYQRRAPRPSGEEMVVAKVYSMQEIELRPEMDPADFERVFAAEVAPAPVLPGLKARLLKGNRGARDGK
jgi:hypothetical protein